MMTRTRHERMAAGARALRTRAAEARAKRAEHNDPRVEAFENLLSAIDSVLLALEIESEPSRRLN